MGKTSDDVHLLSRLRELLGINKHKPSTEGLRKVIAAFIQRVPFENVSKLYYRKKYGLRMIPDLERYVDGIEQHNFGGTCYSNNQYLYRLLHHLGYDVRLCGADMNRPDVHLTVMVVVEGREFLCDAGYGAPFLEPLPRDLDHDHVVALGNEQYILRPQDERGYSRVDHVRDGEIIHGYTTKPMHREVDFFAEAFAHSCSDDGAFMNQLMVARFWPGRSLVIRNLNVIRSEGLEVDIQKLGRREQIPSIVEEHVGIDREIVAEAVADLSDLSGMPV
ncbi:hypothetical protein GF377_08790 [candidate division GN15 bacterium]|nr:hypothetical protein [candidate division GN15 bacterium]